MAKSGASPGGRSLGSPRPPGPPGPQSNHARAGAGRAGDWGAAGRAGSASRLNHTSSVYERARGHGAGSISCRPGHPRAEQSNL
eukprot:163027-Prorocentrum_minimum.AAC.1